MFDLAAMEAFSMKLFALVLLVLLHLSNVLPELIVVIHVNLSCLQLHLNAFLASSGAVQKLRSMMPRSVA